MSHIVLLYGGQSAEHTVSRKSAASVFNHLHSSHKITLIGISCDGAWYQQDLPTFTPDSLDILISPQRRIAVLPGGGLIKYDKSPLKVDLVFLALHGNYGEDGCVQGLLEIAGLPYSGSRVLGSALGMDKEFTRKIWQQRGLPVVPYRALEADKNKEDLKTGALGDSLFAEFGCPLFIKPAHGGSSLGVSQVHHAAEFKTALELAWKYDQKILVEPIILGQEIECAVVGHDTVKTFPLGEIQAIGPNQFYDYEAKYKDPRKALLRVPANLSEALSDRLRRLAVAAYQAVDARSYARIDFLLNEEEVFLNEINTLPGLTPASLFPKMLHEGSLDFEEALEKIIADGLRIKIRSFPCP